MILRAGVYCVLVTVVCCVAVAIARTGVLLLWHVLCGCDYCAYCVVMVGIVFV